MKCVYFQPAYPDCHKLHKLDWKYAQYGIFISLLVLKSLSDWLDCLLHAEESVTNNENCSISHTEGESWLNMSLLSNVTNLVGW